MDAQTYLEVFHFFHVDLLLRHPQGLGAGDLVVLAVRVQADAVLDWVGWVGGWVGWWFEREREKEGDCMHVWTGRKTQNTSTLPCGR